MTETVIENDVEKEIESIQQENDRLLQELEKMKIELQQVKEKAPREYSEEEERISQKQITACNEALSAKAIIEQQKAFDNVMVTGKFHNRRAPGQPAKLTYIKYADDPVKWYTFEDQQVYTIPRGFADQINDYYHTPKFIQKPQGSYVLSETTTGDNSAIADVDRSTKKYAFTPVGF